MTPSHSTCKQCDVSKVSANCRWNQSQFCMYQIQRAVYSSLALSGGGGGGGALLKYMNVTSFLLFTNENQSVCEELHAANGNQVWNGPRVTCAKQYAPSSEIWLGLKHIILKSKESSLCLAILPLKTLLLCLHVFHKSAVHFNEYTRLVNTVNVEIFAWG